MSVAGPMYELLEKIATRRRKRHDTVELPFSHTPPAKRAKRSPVASRPGFKPGKPRHPRRRARHDTVVMKLS